MKRLIFITLLMTLALTGCGDSITKIVETKEGTYVVNPLGEIKKLEGNKLIAVENDKGGVTPASVLTKSQVIPGKKFDLKFTVKAKLADDSTLYKINIELPEVDRNQDRKLFFNPNSEFRTAKGFDGVTSIDVNFVDKDGFEVGSDTFLLNADSWSLLLGENGVIEKLGLSEIRNSPRQRRSEATRINISWRDSSK